MSKNIKIFLVAVLVSLPLWWEINLLKKNLENFFFLEQTKDIYLRSQIAKPPIDYYSFKPIRDWKIKDLKISARSAISVEVTTDNKQKILFKKASDKRLPIASLSKLMVAMVVSESNYNLDDKVKITKEMVDQEGDSGHLRVGEVLTVKDLLDLALIESSNDAAYALASEHDRMKQENFIDLMNLTGKALGLKNTYFVNPTGLDPDNPSQISNYSTAGDLVKLTESLLKKPLILSILSTPELDLYSLNGIHHKLKTTNELMREDLSWSNLIVGGKTGWTPKAKGCLLLILKSPRGKGYLINIILGSENRFEEMKKLTNWVLSAYKW